MSAAEGKGPLFDGSRAIADVYLSAAKHLRFVENDDAVTEEETQRAVALAEGAQNRLLLCGINHPRHAAYAALEAAYQIESLVDMHSVPADGGARRTIDVDRDFVKAVESIFAALIGLADFVAGQTGEDLKPLKALLGLTHLT